MTPRTRQLLAGLAALLVGIAASPGARAAGSDFVEAMRARRLILLHPAEPRPPAVEVLVLPVSRAFDQRSTSLCWVYATLSGLETALRVVQPASTVELSRRALQHATIEERWVRRIHQAGTYTGERGVAVDAMRFIRERGLVAFADFADVDDVYGHFDIEQAVAGAAGIPQQLRAMRRGVDIIYGVLPSITHLGDQTVSPAALAAAVVSGQRWESYAVSPDGSEGYRPHPDPDARPGAVSWHMPVAKLVARIRRALRSGYPVELTIGGHCVLINGAGYDQAGQPVWYRIKDSYPGYFYKADPARVMRHLVEVSTAKLAGD